MKRVCVLLDNAYNVDYRVRNQIDTLRNAGYHVDLYALQDAKLPYTEEHDQLTIERSIDPIIYRPLNKKYKAFKKAFCARIAAENYTVIHCHDYLTTDLGVDIKARAQNEGRKVSLIYDAHEYFQSYFFYERIDNWLGRMKGRVVYQHLRKRLNKNILSVDRIISVSQSICDALEQIHPSDAPAVLIRNLPEKVTLCDRSENYFNRHFNIPEDARLMIHTGNTHFATQRLIPLIRLLKTMNIHLIFIGASRSIEQTRSFIEEKRLTENIHFHPKVPREELVKYCCYADIGLVFIWNKKWLSYWYALPNKLMDVSMAGLPVLSTAQHELESFVTTYQSGICFDGDDPADLELALKELLAKYDTYKRNAEKIRETLNWETESKKLLDLYAALYAEA